MTVSPILSANDAQPSLREMIGQKLMLDFRYFCETGDASKCRKPMTQLPPSLQKLLQTYQIGGVILFAENVQNTEQIVNLTKDLNKVSQTPIFISIDQEGGRVARINRSEATSFTGNMSIGATYPKHGDKYATEVAKVIAKELSSLGINVNFAPTVDVNANPLNPVINVRSFGEDPKLVAKLGAAQVKAFEDRGVISALKHFPGHGDTQVDSHTGLPKVEHALSHVKQRDLLPFAHIIQAQQPGMIMTAHIQYPALDNSTIVNSKGEQMIRPATMSKAIMHNLLREEMGYQGVTITDALDMAGISDFFTPIDAVVETFKAGVDIALMPIPVRTPSDIEKFERFFESIVTAVSEGKLQQPEVATSYHRIMRLKDRIAKFQSSPTAAIAKATLGNPQHRQLEAELALAAITNVKNDGLLPIKPKAGQHIHLIMPDRQKATAMKQALQQATPASIKVTITSLQAYKPERAEQFIADADIVISAHASPQQSAAEIGGMDDVAELKSYELSKQAQPKALLKLMQYAHSRKKASVFISLRAPYEISKYAQYNQAVLASYAYNVDVTDENDVRGPAYTALANVILGNAEALGRLPVSIDMKSLKK
ncbi:glycoside hydrolase family 3 protein [Pseudoalteromonas luteoviolacea]|uniref:beta-N-acetylhexosaminidase n=1 Tax=Pseudoalteromonas luteoviolacea S4060-1 TaxID=1365257 RepID=A0A167P9X2_9GAMM|nr:glycoside hydrolase family 3 protein [Pseudoalteromonas luteoviolacea]KZN69833.1 hypothetical protein N478_10070 [Pseudoalteromonas luteoviolacea S4060-1]